MYVLTKVCLKVEVSDGEHGVARLKRQILPGEPASVDHDFGYFAKHERLEKLLRAVNSQQVVEKIDELIDAVEKAIHEARAEG